MTSGNITHLVLLISVAGGIFFLLSQPVLAQHAAVCTRVTDIPRHECEALVTLYDSACGNGWDQREGWLTGVSACEWYGIDCRDGHVSEISLRGNRLAGPLPPELGNLSGLRYLDLGDNQLSGPLPSELNNLRQLTGLNLRNNHLQGEIPPEFGKLINLEWLYLSQNPLSGLLPVTFTQLSHLEILYFRETRVCEPLAPAFQSWLAAIPSAGSSGIACDCRVIQEIPEAECNALFVLFEKTRGSWWNSADLWLQTLSPCAWEGVTCGDGHVETIVLPANNLQGPLPPEIGNLARMTSLDLSHNELNGQLLPEIGKLVRLTALDLSHNMFSGPIPDELGALLQLTSLDLSHNYFERHLPPTLGNLVSLTYLDLSCNRFENVIPIAIGNLGQLTALDLSDNFFQRGLPPTFDKLTALTRLDLSNTRLRGTLPLNLYRFSALEELQIQQTNLCEPPSYIFRNWKKRLHLFESTQSICPSTYQGLLPLLIIIAVSVSLLVSARHQAFRAIFGEARLESAPECDSCPGQLQLPQNLPLAILAAAVFGVSTGLFLGVATIFTTGSLVYGLGIGLILYLAFALLSGKTARRATIKWVGLVLGILAGLFIAIFMLLTIELPATLPEIVCIVGYVGLVAATVWFMTSGITTGGYLELIAGGIVLGGIWGAITGGVLGALYCHHSPVFYGGMSDILMYRVFSASLNEEIRRFLANEMTGVFLFSLTGGFAAALTRIILLRVTKVKSELKWEVGNDN